MGPEQVPPSRSEWNWEWWQWRDTPHFLGLLIWSLIIRYSLVSYPFVFKGRVLLPLQRVQSVYVKLSRCGYPCLRHHGINSLSFIHTYKRRKCSILVPIKHKHRYDRVGTAIHRQLYKCMGIEHELMIYIYWSDFLICVYWFRAQTSKKELMNFFLKKNLKKAYHSFGSSISSFGK